MLGLSDLRELYIFTVNINTHIYIFAEFDDVLNNLNDLGIVEIIIVEKNLIFLTLNLCLILY